VVKDERIKRKEYKISSPDSARLDTAHLDAKEMLQCTRVHGSARHIDYNDIHPLSLNYALLEVLFREEKRGNMWFLW
jgi:hypothetical protein